MKVFSTNEYGNLKSAVIGRPDNAVYPKGDRFYSQWVRSNPKWKQTDHAIPDTVISAARDDLFMVRDILNDHGVKAWRPEIIDHRQTISDIRYTVTGYNSWNSRDFLLTLDNMVIECPSPFTSKHRESHAYQVIKNEAIADGVRWIAAPTPRMEPAEAIRKNGGMQLTERYPIFTGSNILKFDDKLLYFKCSTNNNIGSKWLQSVIGSEYEVIVWDKMNPDHNLDFGIMPIAKNLILVNAERINGNNLPNFLRSYNKLWIEKCLEDNYYTWPMSSSWTGMNILCLSENKVMINSTQKNLIKQLEANKVECVRVPLSHTQTFGGGLHRIITDLERT
jgi:hypothetical protein